MSAALSNGQQVEAAHKAVLPGMQKVRVRNALLDQTKEAYLMLRMQTPQLHPSGRRCSNLPRLIAAKCEDLMLTSLGAGEPKRQCVVPELLMGVAESGSLFEILQGRKRILAEQAQPRPLLPLKLQ
eukprot:jgi/Ulvmu1/12067/UM083_0080.1